MADSQVPNFGKYIQDCAKAFSAGNNAPPMPPELLTALNGFAGGAAVNHALGLLADALIAQRQAAAARKDTNQARTAVRESGKAKEKPGR